MCGGCARQQMRCCTSTAFKHIKLDAAYGVLCHASFEPGGARAGDGVLLGAGVCVLGAHYVGAGSKVGAGSVVVTDLPAHCVAVGVPARIIKQGCLEQPSENMDFVEDFILDYVI